ncbi:MAG: hypothetical protein K2X86_10550, partial [Cytophagaceae bacterium]|nr:hypothetical protein [Cytophagaceae bacterium]
FSLDANAKFRTESGTPYALAGDGSTGYNAWVPAIGSHTITATPYSASGGSGTKGIAQTINFTVQNGNVTPAPAPTPAPVPTVGHAIVSFTLVNADTEKDIMTLTEGSVINFSKIGTNKISVRANTSGSTGSVVFGLDGNAKYHVENGAPYSLKGDSNANYAFWTPTVGSHSVTATPYSASNLGGTKGTPLKINFTVVAK